MLDTAYLAARAALIDPEARTPEPGAPPRGGTMYLVRRRQLGHDGLA